MGRGGQGAVYQVDKIRYKIDERNTKLIRSGSLNSKIPIRTKFASSPNKNNRKSEIMQYVIKKKSLKKSSYGNNAFDKTVFNEVLINAQVATKFTGFSSLLCCVFRDDLSL